MLGLLCVEQNGVGSILAVYFDFFFKFWQFTFALDCICIATKHRKFPAKLY